MPAFDVIGGTVVLASLAIVFAVGLGLVVFATVVKFGFPDRLAFPARVRRPRLSKPVGRHAAVPVRKGLDRLVKWR